MVSYIIASNYMVGIDIELHDNNLNVLELADLVLTSKESLYFSGLNFQEQIRLFYHIWVKKEALVKANGQGLSYGINTIETMSLLSGKSIVLASGKKAVKEESKWYYYELETPENYSGAIATEQKIDEIFYIEMNKENIFYHL
jgi:4'-phosphopantetheinyl transferase